MQRAVAIPPRHRPVQNETNTSVAIRAHGYVHAPEPAPPDQKRSSRNTSGITTLKLMNRKLCPSKIASALVKDAGKP